MKPDLILCDFDGTLCERDIGTAILERWCAIDWQSLEDRWQNGLTSSRENMTKQWSAVRASADEIARFAAAQRPRRGARRFLERAARAGLRMVVASDGLDLYIGPFLAAHGMDRLVTVYCASMRREPDGWRLETPLARPERCRFATCKCAVMEELLPDGGPFILIGDGVTDVCCAKRAQLVFARSKLLEYARANGMDCVAFETFDEIGDHLFGPKGR